MIFVDAWAWIALAVKKDQYHASAKAQHKRFCKAGRKYVTTDYVLSEVISFLYDRPCAHGPELYQFPPGHVR